MNTIKAIHDAYPDSDLLGIPLEITSETTLDQLEAIEYQKWRGVSDTLFMFLCRELASPRDVCDRQETGQRLDRAMRDLAVVSEKLVPDHSHGSHLATLIGSHLHAIMTLSRDQCVTLSLQEVNVEVKHVSDGYIFTREGKSAHVGNLYGAIRGYLELVFLFSKTVWVFEHE